MSAPCLEHTATERYRFATALKPGDESHFQTCRLQHLLLDQSQDTAQEDLRCPAIGTYIAVNVGAAAERAIGGGNEV
jgi:hypothetical protein